MSTLNTFNLPDVGEGLTEAEIVAWKVKEGDTVSVNDVLVEIETAKSIVELPSPYAGVVAQLLVGEGQTVDVGTAIISIGDGPAAAGVPHKGVPTGANIKIATGAPQTRPSAGTESATVPASSSSEPEEAAAKPLVGSGPKADAVKRRPRKAAVGNVAAVHALTTQSSAGVSTSSAAATSATAVPAAPAATAATPSNVPAQHGAAPAGSGRAGRALAKPPVRKAAKELGISLSDVQPTGLHGEVTKKDLLSFQQGTVQQQGAGTVQPTGAQRIERIPVKGVRKATAKAMVDSAFSAPHVSIFIEVDATRTMEFVKRLKASRDFEGIKVSPLLILAKAVIWAAARNPMVNAAWTDQEILVKHFMNLGIAAATPRGLMVPNIKDAQNLSLKELAVALTDLAVRARSGLTQPAEMTGGSMTITNIGVLGLDTGTPILNPGEVGIVAFGVIKQKPWVVDGAIVPRWITTLGGSFDHRVVDGDVSARFLADVASVLEEPALLLD